MNYGFMCNIITMYLSVHWERYCQRKGQTWLVGTSLSSHLKK